MNREQIEQEQQQLAQRLQQLQQEVQRVQTRIVENRGILRYLREQEESDTIEE